MKKFGYLSTITLNLHEFVTNPCHKGTQGANESVQPCAGDSQGCDGTDLFIREAALWLVLNVREHLAAIDEFEDEVE